MAAGGATSTAKPCETVRTFTTLGSPGVPTLPTMGLDAALTPKKFVATAEHEYAWPVARPATEMGEVAPFLKWLAPPDVGVQVTRYDRIELALLGPARNDTFSEPFALGAGPETIDSSVGAPGDPTINAPDAADPTPGPTAFVADTLHV